MIHTPFQAADQTDQQALLLHAGRVQCIVMSVSVRGSVCEHISKTTCPHFTKFLCMLPMAMALSSSGGTALCYVLPVLRMMSRFLQQTVCAFGQPLMNERHSVSATETRQTVCIVSHKLQSTSEDLPLFNVQQLWTLVYFH